MKQLRKQAKSIASKRPKALEKDVSSAGKALERERLLHDLRVHQIELETQNRELRETHQLLEISRDRYADLYDFAPVGYVTFDDRGLIREINLTAAGMLGAERARLIGLPFHPHVACEHVAIFREHLRKLSKPGDQASTELTLVCKRGRPTAVGLQSVLVKDEETKGFLCRTVLTDIRQRKQAEESLRNHETRLRAVLDSAVEGIITINEQGVIESFNPAAEKIFGYTADELIGQNISRLMPSPYREAHDRYLANYWQSGERKIIGLTREVFGLRKDGSMFPMELAVSEVKLGDRRIFTGFVRDATRRREAEGALRRSEALLAQAQEIAHVGGYEINVAGTGGDHWSAETFRILGLDPARKEMTPGEYISRCVHPRDQARVREAFDKSLNERVRFDLEYCIVRPDGSLRHVQSIVEPLPDVDRQVVKLVGTLQDITERKELEQEILDISEREQSRIGQDLHDGLCQHLAGIEFRLLTLKQKLSGKSKQQVTETTELARVVRQAMEQTRTLARGLSPVMLEAGGLMNALQELAINTEQAFHISCAFNFPAPVLIHDNAVATHLYRIAQEAIHNAIRHGKAKFIVINLLTVGDRIVLGIKDDGAGFPIRLRKTKGMGLRIMRYRAGMINASLVVQRDRQGGTSVVCSFRTGRAQETKRPKWRASGRRIRTNTFHGPAAEQKDVK